MAIKIIKQSIKDAARSSDIKGYTYKELEISLEQDLRNALQESGVKNGTYRLKDTGLRADVIIDTNGDIQIKNQKVVKTQKKNKSKSTKRKTKRGRKC